MIPVTHAQPNHFAALDQSQINDLRRRPVEPGAGERTQRLPRTFDSETAAQRLSLSYRTKARNWAGFAPFDQKHVLRQHDCRWNGGKDGGPKAWWTEVDEELLAGELRFSERDIDLRDVDMRHDLIIAYERDRAT